MRQYRKKRKQTLRCTCCGNVLDPNGYLHRVHEGPFRGDYCRACFFRIAFKCRQCGGAYLLNRRVSNHNLCRGCEHRSHYDPAHDVRWHKASAMVGTTFESIKSVRRFGVEIETAQCNRADRIKGQTPFGAKYDGTISGKEFDSPILSGDEGLAVVYDFCDIAKRRAWTVDERCGTHVHLDMTHERNCALRAIATGYFHTYPSWAKLVDPSRVGNEFCGPPDYSARSVLSAPSFLNVADRSSRYTFINIAAYNHHRTFEIRGLEGTLDKNLLANWIIAHLTFADFCATLTVEQVTELFNKPEAACWHSLKKHTLGDTARYLGRLRAKRIKSEHRY